MSSDGLPAPDTGNGMSTVQIKPPGKSLPNELVDWVDDALPYGAGRYWLDFSMFRRAELFDGNRQWLRQAYGGISGAGSAYQWQDWGWQNNDPRRLPIPDFPFGLNKRLNESARLSRPQFRPVCRPKGMDPGLKEKSASKHLQHMLNYRLDKMNWESQEDLMTYHMPLYGGAWIVSRWEEDWRETSLRPLTSATRCPNENCDFLLSDRVVPIREFISSVGPGNLNTIQPFSPEKGSVDHCPTCLDHPKMIPFSPSLEEAGGMKDVLDRDLGERKPKGDWTVKIASPYDVFPWNMGYDMRPGNIDDVTYVHAEKLTWIWEHYPENASKVRPENPSTLMYFHPIAGAPDLMSDTKAFRDMCRVKERIQFPKFRKIEKDGEFVGYQQDAGRYVVTANREVLYDGNLLMPSANKPGRTVPRVYVDYIPWELLDGGRRLQGYSQWRIMFDAQEIINEIVSQTQAVRRHTALPMYVVSREHDLEVQELDIGRPAQFLRIQLDPDNPQFIPTLINNETIASGVQTELKFAKEDFLDGMFPAIESGSAEPSVDSAAQLRKLLEETGTTREPRIRRQKQALTRICLHGADLIQNMYGPDDARECRYEDEDGREQWDYFEGADLDAEVEIEVEPSQPDVEKERAAITTALQNQVIVPSQSPAMQKKLVEKLAGEDVAEFLFEDEHLQEDCAEREWIDFRDKGRIPEVDPSIDDNNTHFVEHGRDCFKEWFRAEEDKGGWDAALGILGSQWFESLELVAFPPPVPVMQTVPDPMTGMPVQQPMVDPMTGQPQMQPAPIPPVSLQIRIGQMWMQKLDGAGFWPPQDKEIDTASLARVMSWRAHTEAHRLYGEMAQRRASGGPSLAAPGADATAAGNVPTATEASASQVGGPGVSAESRQAQQQQQQQVRAMSQG